MVPFAALAGGLLLRIFTFETAKYLAYRAFMIALVMGLGPIVLFKGFGLIMKFLGNYGVGVLNSLMASVNLEPQVVGLWGVGAYLGSLLRIQEGIAIYLSFLILKFTWSLLPKWGMATGLVKYS